MDIKAKIDEIVNKVKSEPDIAKKFQSDPVKTVEGILGVDLPDDVINQIVDGVKAKVNINELKDKLGGLGDFSRSDVLTALFHTTRKAPPFYKNIGAQNE